MRQIANVIGASGLVGKELVKQILDHDEFEKVRIFVRRPSGINHPKLEEQIIDFEQPDSWRPLVKGDVLFSTLGTTIKTAKTKENQYRVDFTYQYEFAKAASENGVPNYLLVSSMGADPKSSVFYSRIKGERYCTTIYFGWQSPRKKGRREGRPDLEPLPDQVCPEGVSTNACRFVGNKNDPFVVGKSSGNPHNRRTRYLLEKIYSTKSGIIRLDSKH